MPLLAPIRNICMIRQWGKIYHYFDVRKSRTSWSGLSYAHGRGWRVMDTLDKGNYVTYKCEPLKVRRVGSYEFEVKGGTVS